MFDISYSQINSFWCHIIYHGHICTERALGNTPSLIWVINCMTIKANIATDRKLCVGVPLDCFSWYSSVHQYYFNCLCPIKMTTLLAKRFITESILAFTRCSVDTAIILAVWDLRPIQLHDRLLFSYFTFYPLRMFKLIIRDIWYR